MSDNLYKVLSLENDMLDCLYDNTVDEDKLVMLINKINKILPKLSNKEIMYLLQNGSVMHDYTNVLDYLKKYKINKTELKKDNSYKEELRKLNSFLELINDSYFDDNEYKYICRQCDIDNVASFLLSKMSNEDIMMLSNESDDWNYKLFLYGNLKS